MFFDIGIGMLVSIFGAEVLHLPFALPLVLLSIIFALLPDIDMLSLAHPKLNIFFSGHRGWMHNPLMHLVIACDVWIWFGWKIALLFVLGVLIHLIHDTFWIGSGVAWFWPFSDKRYKFFSQEHAVNPGDGWIKAFYFRLNVVTIAEYGVFFVSIVLFYFYLFFT